jgi:hypothetical protein
MVSMRRSKRSPSAWDHVVGRFAGDKSGITDKLTFSFNF